MVYPWWSRTKVLITCLLHPSRDQQRSPSLCVCVCVNPCMIFSGCIGACVYIWVCLCTCGSQKWASSAPQDKFFLDSWDRVSHLYLELTNFARLADQQFPWTYLSTKPELGFHVCHHAWFVLNTSSGDYTTPHVCAASTFPTEPPPQLNIGLIFTCYFSTINFCKPGHGLCLLGL